jgi:hypothetical protein
MVLISRICVRENWGITMRFQRVIELANNTPTSVLCEAWGESPGYVESVKRAEQSLSIREAGDLAEMHGLLLEDILSV